jgi:hypothetical protein
MARLEKGLPATTAEGETIRVSFSDGFGLICNNLSKAKHASKTDKNAAKRDRKRRRK